MTSLKMLAELTEELNRRDTELIAQYNLLRAVIDEVPAFIYAKDRESRFVVANETVLKHFGVEELTGKTELDLLPEEEAHQRIAEEQAIIAGGSSIRRVHPYEHPSGETRVCMDIKVPWHDNGGIIGVIGIAYDIGEDNAR